MSTGGMLPNPCWLMTLNEYQRDNLLWLLGAIMSGRYPELSILDTGDWVGEIYWALGGIPFTPNDTKRKLTSVGKPNKTWEDLDEHFKRERGR